MGYAGGRAIGPEQSEAYEIGLKTRFGNGFLLNIAAYWETVKDLQVQTFVVSPPAYFVSNAGSLRARGVEADFKYAPTTEFAINGNVSFNDAKFTSFKRAQCYDGQTVAQGCVPDADAPSSFITDATGNRLQNAPKWSGTIGVDYEPMVSAALRAHLHMDVYGRSKVNFSANGNPFTRQKGYFLANAGIGIGADEGMWRATLFCRNCFDQRFVTYIESFIGGIAGDYGQTFGLTSFRTVGVSLDVKF